jgi:hypothetical protein
VKVKTGLLARLLATLDVATTLRWTSQNTRRTALAALWRVPRIYHYGRSQRLNTWLFASDGEAVASVDNLDSGARCFRIYADEGDHYGIPAASRQRP